MLYFAMPLFFTCISPSDPITNVVGIALLSKYSMVFELISIVLLVAIVGSLVLARQGRTRTGGES